jgi:GNAT superfamily N-acetyltransferase
VTQVMTTPLPSLVSALSAGPAPAFGSGPAAGAAQGAASTSGAAQGAASTSGIASAGSAGRIELAGSPSEEWLAAVAGRKGPLPESARHVLTAVRNVRFAGWYDEHGTLLATARGCVADDEGRWLGLSLIGVDERLRRRGLAQRLVAALCEWATTLGARDAYLQVEQRNTPAVTLYERLGFTVHHVYSSRRLLTSPA